MQLRSIELEFPRIAAAADFLVGTWGLAPAETRKGALYLRGAGELPYLVGLFEAEAERVRSMTFVCDEGELDGLRDRVASSGSPMRAVESNDPGGGHGIEVELPEGEIFRFLAGSGRVAPIEGRDLPNKLTHVVLSATDAEASGTFAEEVLGFTVSDRTKGMVFVRCNRSHHAIAFARAGYSSLNHIAFEMSDIDGVMRGIGRLRDAGSAPVWGPGRHGPGDNVFAYFIAPFGAVIEFSTATNLVDEDYRTGAPDDWTWPDNRIDQWGVSSKDVNAIAEAEKRFRFRRDWIFI
jgi:catechol 2,3-dioxygenase-like lactoylglutathione lyase family enzyme